MSGRANGEPSEASEPKFYTESLEVSGYRTEEIRKASFKLIIGDTKNGDTELADVTYSAFFSQGTSVWEAGFYYTGVSDRVVCFCCGLEVHDWSRNDDPWVVHARYSSKCPFLLQKKGEDFANNHAGASQMRTGKALMSSKQARLESFEKWHCPENMVQKPQDLAEAGWFYTGVCDYVRCFACGWGAYQWEASDIPWEEHANKKGDCPFLREKKGEDFIEYANFKARLHAAQHL